MADRSITTGFWDHDDVQGLAPLDKSIYLYLMTAPGSHICGLYICTFDTIAFHTKWQVSEVRESIARLCKKKRIVYDESLVFVRNMSKWQKAEKFGGFKHHVKKVSIDLRKPQNKAYKAFCKKFETLLEPSENPPRTLPQTVVLEEPFKKGSRTLSVISNSKKIKKRGVGKNTNPPPDERVANLDTIPEWAELEKAVGVRR